MPGSAVTTLPGSSVSSSGASRRRNGASCTSSPTPCPAPWPYCSARPAASIALRDAASAARWLTPGWSAASRSSCALRHSSYASASCWGEVARRERPCAVGAVPVDARARVDDHQRPGGDRHVTWATVRACRVVARRDEDVERELVGSELAETLLYPPGQVAFGAPREPFLRQRLVDLVGNRSGPPDRRDLVPVLDGAQRLDHAVRRQQVHARSGEPSVRGIAHVSCFECDAAAGESLRDEPRRSRGVTTSSTPSTSLAASAYRKSV